MMDRYNRIFLRTLRSLCDMRRHSSPVIVGQMNVSPSTLASDHLGELQASGADAERARRTTKALIRGR